MYRGTLIVIRIILAMAFISTVTVEAKTMSSVSVLPVALMSATDSVETATSEDLSVLNQQIDINKATESEWISIKGVGPKKAKAILEYKTLIGGFKSIDDLLGVRGIGEKALAKMRPMLKV